MCGLCGLPRLLNAVLAPTAAAGQPTGSQSVKPAAAPTTRKSTGCPACAATIAPEYAWCPNCGRALRPYACSHCGQMLEPGQNVCPYCGAPGQSAAPRAA